VFALVSGAKIRKCTLYAAKCEICRTLKFHVPTYFVYWAQLVC
jgi:hypothetical protein